MKQFRVQHKATICVAGVDERGREIRQNVDMHAPPFATVSMLENWLTEALSQPGRTLVSKSWATPKPPEAA